MKLVIQAHALKSEPLSQAITAQFDERGGTIGRSDTNTLTLPDPERHVSRLQAEVLFAAQGFSIRNVGSANPIEINGRALRPGEGAPLVAGDQLVIGGYAMRVVAEKPAVTGDGRLPEQKVDARAVIRASAGEARTDPPARPAVPARPPQVPMAPSAKAASAMAPPSEQDPFADLMGSVGASSAADPFDGLLGPAATPAPGGRRPAPAPPVATAPVVRLPDDFDPFADPSPVAQSGSADADLAGFMASPLSASGQPAARKATPSDSGLGDLLGLGQGGSPASNGPSLDAMFGLDAGKGSVDLLGDFLTPGQSTAHPARGDVLDLFSESTNRAMSPTEPAAFHHTPELSGAYSPPVVKGAYPQPPRQPIASAPMPFAPTVPVAAALRAPGGADRPKATPSSASSASTPPAPAPQPGQASPQALWQAFCEGAGITLQLPGGLTPQTMRDMGQVMRHAVEGTLKLVSARAAAKQELRAQVTTIQSKHNNPLKFSVDPQQALAQLLQPPMRGFMPGADAVRDAMDDLLGHQIGTMTGTRAALQGMLKRFEPARLEAKLANKGVIDAVLPMNRRAKLWELYVEHYQHVQDEAQDDFHELFGKAFVKAYEQQLDRLEASRRKAV